MMQQTMQQPMSAIQPLTQLWPLDPQYSQFHISMNFPDNYELNQRSPMVACATAREIQNHVQQNANAVRINAFNVISQNQYQNPLYQDLVRYILVRIYMGLRAGEFQMVDPAADTTIRYLVKYYSAELALQNQQVLSSLDSSVITALQNDARQWEYQKAMCSGSVAFTPFAAQQLTDTLGSFNPVSQVQNPGQVQNSGAFQVGAHQQQYQNQYVNNGNNAQQGLNRYQRQLQEEKNMLQGSMQTALAGMGGMPGMQIDESRWDHAVKASNQRLADRGIPVAGAPQPSLMDAATMTQLAAQASQQAQNQQQQVQYLPVEEAPEVKSFLMVHTLGIGDDRKEYGVLRRVPYENHVQHGITWRPTKLQLHHPAIGQIGQKLVYHELENGIWIAVIEEEPMSTTEKLFDYDAHAIDPTMGIPDPVKPPPEIIPEQKPDFNKSEKRQLNIVCTGKPTVELTAENIVQSTVAKAKRQQAGTEAYLGNGIVLDTHMFANADAANGDMEVAKGLVTASSFEAAISQLQAITDEKFRKAISDRLCRSVNRWLVHRADLAVTISNFEEDAPELYNFIAGSTPPCLDLQIVADRLKRDVGSIIASAFNVHPSATFKEMITALTDIEYTDEQLARMLVILDTTAALWVKPTEQELGIVMNEDHACTITKKSLPWLAALAECAITTCEKEVSTRVQQITLVTSDNKRFVLSLSCFSDQVNKSYLIRRPFDKAEL